MMDSLGEGLKKLGGMDLSRPHRQANEITIRTNTNGAAENIGSLT